MRRGGRGPAIARGTERRAQSGVAGSVHRFYVDHVALEVGAEVRLPAPLSHQARHVLRLRKGEAAVLFDGSGYDFTVDFVELTAIEAVVRVISRERNQAEPPLAVTLYVAPLKGDHFAWTLQKGTEVGAAAFVPIVTSRTIATPPSVESQKLERWRRIVREAAEQAGRGVVPVVSEPLPFEDGCRRASGEGLALIASAHEPSHTLLAAMRARCATAGVSLFIGPEGGFSAREVAVARELGVESVTLGPRILRAETAAVVATTLALATADRLESGPHAISQEQA